MSLFLSAAQPLHLAEVEVTVDNLQKHLLALMFDDFIIVIWLYDYFTSESQGLESSILIKGG